MNEKNVTPAGGKEFSQKVRENVEVAKEQFAEGSEKLGSQVQAIEAYLKDVGSRLMDVSKELCETVDKQARLHPWTTGTVAFVSGVLVAYALSRRNR